VAVILVRLPVLLAHRDTWYPFEIHAGTIARALLDGLDLDVAILPIIEHARGSVLFGVLLAPIYALGGASSITMKLLPVVWHALTVAWLVSLLDRYFNRRAAWCGGALFLFAPPMIAKLSTLGLASHLESSLPFLLAWGAYLAWTTNGATRGRAFGFGAALGFAGFFHLQAFIPSALLLGLLVLRERTAMWSANGLWLGSGAALFAAPSFLFDGGAVALVRSGVFTKEAGAESAVAAPDRIGKLGDLLTVDLASTLEFGVSWAGPVYVGALALGTLIALWSLRRPTSPTSATASTRPALIFVLHAVVVAGLYVVSNLSVVPEIGTGATNRHLAPLITSLLVFVACGAASSRFSLLPIAVMVGAGILAIPGTVGGDEASRRTQRGSCYEWFSRQLNAGLQGDVGRFVERLGRVDDGDPRFRSLRFEFRVPEVESYVQALLKRRPGVSAGSSDASALIRWTAVGRALTGKREELARIVKERRLAGLDARAHDALLHGVGLELEPPRAVWGLERVRRFLGQLDRRFSSLPPDAARAFAEGYGFQLGFVADPYNANLGEVIVMHREVDTAFHAPFARGLGWGARQRVLVAPTVVPDGLELFVRLNDTMRPAFVEAYCGRTLPREAEAFDK